MPEKRPYHHGNLRETLIEVAVELLRETGVGDVSLRATAARAGVSRMAPSHHFGGKDGLLAAVAARGYEKFAEAMQIEFDLAGPTAAEKLRGISKGYLIFARTQPALFDLIFNDEKRYSWTDELTVASAKSYSVLRKTCAMFTGQLHGSDVIEKLVWSVVHGYAVLSRRELVGPTEDFGDLFAMLDALHLQAHSA